MNVRVLFFAFTFALLVNVMNYLLYNADVSIYNSVYTQHSSDSAFNFIDTIKNIIFPSTLVSQIPFFSLKALFLSIYYFSLAYSLVALIIKALPFIGNG